MDDAREVFAETKALLISGDYQTAFGKLCSEKISCQDDFTVQARASKLFAQIPLGILSLRTIKIAVLASSTIDHFLEIFRFWCARDGFEIELWTSPYNTVSATILNKESELYSFKPDLVWLFTTWRDVHFDDVNGSNGAEAVASAVQKMAALWGALRSGLACAIWQNNADIPEVDCFGNFAGQLSGSRRHALRRYNLGLAEAAPAGVVVFDIDHIASLYGKARWTDSRYWFHSKNAFSFDAYGMLAFSASRLLAAQRGAARKALVLDLDNTLWGGVIGDDGLSGIALGTGADGEAFVAFQQYILSLKQRGVILAICSKNEEANAREPFLKHPDCQIKLEDIAVFRANWNNKADNIRDIAATLNIGLESLVFVDDNPVERNLVREFLPMVAVPELPEDPTTYIETLEREHYFEMVAFSSEDRDRAQYYRENASRAELKDSHTDTSTYLRSLEMVSDVGALDSFHLPRMAQLINKSNQFHLTGTRYTETELQALAARPGHAVRYYKLRDRFGDNGLIAVLVLAANSDGELMVDTWVMSCRVLERTMEKFIAQDIVNVAHEMGCSAVAGRYVPSAKNKLVSSLYRRLGFVPTGDNNGTTTWRLSLDDDLAVLTNFIEKTSNVKETKEKAA